MAKIFYTFDEAIAKLGCEETALKQAVRDGKLREFRDAGKVNYKVDEIDQLADSGQMGGSSAPVPAPPPPPPAASPDDSAPLEIGGLGESGAPGMSGTLSPAKPPGTSDSSVSDLLGSDSADLSASLGSLHLADTGDNPMPDLSSSGSLGLSASGSISLADTGMDLGGGTGGDATQLTDSATDSLLGMSGTGLNLSSAVEDIVSIDDDDSASSGDTTAGKGKDDTVVSSVGISVFDEEDLDESADPAAKTAMSATGSGSTGLEGVGSGSGLLDLTRESDDTSLGAELLDEIYPDQESGAAEMGDATRAGLEGTGAVMPDAADTPFEPAASAAFAATEEIPADEPKGKGKKAKVGKKDKVKKPKAAAKAQPGVTVRTVTFAPDAFSSGSSGFLAVAVVVMCFAGLAIASMIRGVWPSILDFVYAKLWMFGAGSLVLSGIALGVGVFLGRRSSSSE